MKITKAGVSYTLITNFQQSDLQAVQIAAKAVNIRNGIYAEAYDAINNKMNTHYGFYIQSDKVEEQEKHFSGSNKSHIITLDKKQFKLLIYSSLRI